MKLEYDNNGMPRFVMAEADATITITFNQHPINPNLKSTILEMLAAAYEDQVVQDHLHI